MFLPISVVVLTLSACAPSPERTVGPARGGGLDYWGDRPGPQGFTTVILDAGHGGKDSGAISGTTGQMEKAATLDLANRLRGELSGDFRVVMMRSEDRFVELDDRVEFANRYPGAILVSLHFNSGNASRRGVETYWWRVDSHGLAVRCHEAMKSVAAAGENAGMVRRRIRLTRNPSIPCVLLEGGYLSNASEAQQINSAAHRERLAKAIGRAIRAQAANGDAGTGARPPLIKSPPSRPTDAAGS